MRCRIGAARTNAQDFLEHHERLLADVARSFAIPAALLSPPATSNQPFTDALSIEKSDQHAIRAVARGRCLHCGGRCVGSCKRADEQ
jgi:uncharacterized protein (DUF1778 family)